MITINESAETLIELKQKVAKALQLELPLGDKLDNAPSEEGFTSSMASAEVMQNVAAMKPKEEKKTRSKKAKLEPVKDEEEESPNESENSSTSISSESSQETEEPQDLQPEEPSEKTKYTEQDCKNVVAKIIGPDIKNQTRLRLAVEILGKFGVKSASKLTADQFNDFMETASITANSYKAQDIAACKASGNTEWLEKYAL